MRQLQVGTEASMVGSAHFFKRHRPEQTLAYQLVEECYSVFVTQLAVQDTALPEYVQRELDGN